MYSKHYKSLRWFPAHPESSAVTSLYTWAEPPTSDRNRSHGSRCPVETFPWGRSSCLFHWMSCIHTFTGNPSSVSQCAMRPREILALFHGVSFMYSQDFLGSVSCGSGMRPQQTLVLFQCIMRPQETFCCLSCVSTGVPSFVV